MPEPWWKSGVFYQIYPRSFADSDGDGVGDLEGIRGKLDYLEWLGVDAVWISPFFPSPMADFGYDVADYCGVDPLFGTLDGFDRLVDDAHARGIRVIIDWVPNHTSDQHPWFVEARSSPDASKRDWYIWRSGPPDRPPNNWKAAFGGDAWTYDEASGEWYLHLFLPEQPDLNWRNPEVVEAMHGTLRFWLDRGVDGFRIDVVHGLVKHPDLPDVEPEWARAPMHALGDQPLLHELIRGFRRLLDSYADDRMMVGEVYLLSTARVAKYYGQGDELHLAFNFPPLFAPWEAPRWRRRVDRVVEELDPVGAWPSWVLSNHDHKRHRTRYGNDARARAAALLLLTLRGTPFLYQGEELGLEDAVIPPDRVVDPGGRDGCRAPIPWAPGSAHGWPVADPWLPWPPDAETRNAASERHDEGSFLNLYRRLLEARRASPALRTGTWTPLAAPDGVLAYRRDHGDDARTVVVNFTAEEQPVPLPAGLTVEVASDRSPEGELYTGRVRPEAAVILG